MGSDGKEAPNGTLGELWMRGPKCVLARVQVLHQLISIQTVSQSVTLETRKPRLNLSTRTIGSLGELIFCGQVHVVDIWTSGDLAYRDNEGFFYIKDRLKDVIIRGGENIASGAVEAGIYKDERVLDCCVVAVPDPKLNELPVCGFLRHLWHLLIIRQAGMVYLKAAYRSKVKPEEIISIASKHLPKHETPVFIHISDKPLPVNAKSVRSCSPWMRSHSNLLNVFFVQR